MVRDRMREIERERELGCGQVPVRALQLDPVQVAPLSCLAVSDGG